MTMIVQNGLKGKIDKNRFVGNSPDEGEIHCGEDGAEQERDGVWLVEEVQCHVLDSPLVHREERLHGGGDVRRRRKHWILRFRSNGARFCHFSFFYAGALSAT